MLLSKRFLPYITLPTRITPHSATCIDHIFIRNGSKDMLSKVLSGIFYCDISDHLPCYTSIESYQRPKSNINRPKVRLYGDQNCNKFRAAMSDTDWDVIYNDSEDWFDAFLRKVKQNFELCFPLVRVSRKRLHDKPWITQELKTSISHNHRLFRKSIEDHSYRATVNYKDHNRLLKKRVNAAERDYYNKLFESNKESVTNMWKHLGPIINPGKRKKRSDITKIYVDGKIISDPNLIPDILNNHFCNVGNLLQQQIPPHDVNQYKQFLPARIVNSFYLTPVIFEDVLKQIKSLDPKKAVGPDNIGGKVLLICPDIFAYNLTKVYNHFIELGKYPETRLFQATIGL